MNHLADELAAMLDEATGTEGIVLRAVLLVAAVPSQALTRRDGGPQDRIKVSRSQVLRLIELIDATYPGLRERSRELARIDSARVQR